MTDTRNDIRADEYINVTVGDELRKACERTISLFSTTFKFFGLINRDCFSSEEKYSMFVSILEDLIKKGILKVSENGGIKYIEEVDVKEIEKLDSKYMADICDSIFRVMRCFNGYDGVVFLNHCKFIKNMNKTELKLVLPDESFLIFKENIVYGILDGDKSSVLKLISKLKYYNISVDKRNLDTITNVLSEKVREATFRYGEEIGILFKYLVPFVSKTVDKIELVCADIDIIYINKEKNEIGIPYSLLSQVVKRMNKEHGVRMKVENILSSLMVHHKKVKVRLIFREFTETVEKNEVVYLFKYNVLKNMLENSFGYDFIGEIEKNSIPYNSSGMDILMSEIVIL